MDDQTPEVVEQSKTKGHMLDIGSSTLGGELPCGYIDKDGTLHRTYIVKEMTGREEDLLGGKGPILDRMNQVIANCLVRLGAIEEKKELVLAVPKLTSADRMLLLIALRRISLGDYYDVKVKCQNDKCGEDLHFKMDLAKLEVVPMPDPYKRAREDTLTTGRVIKWHIMTSVDEVWLTKRAKKREDIATLAQLSRIDAIDDNVLDREKKFESAVEAVKALTFRERTEFRDLYRENEGSVDTEVEFECKNCDYEWKSELDVGQQSFFFPSAKSRR